MLDGRFGDAGRTLLVEERINGPEASLFALVDGEHALFMGSAQDHKRAYDGDEGPNTGGMGAISPAPRLTEELQQQVMDEIVLPLAKGMADEGTPYRGILYVGLMLTETGPQVIEFNCRLGDPEAQVILPRLRSDLIAAMQATLDGTLGHLSLRWDDATAVTVVMAAKGYPGAYEKGSVIDGTRNLDGRDDVILFHAGTSVDPDGTLRATGGRVLAVTGLALTESWHGRQPMTPFPRLTGHRGSAAAILQHANAAQQRNHEAGRPQPVQTDRHKFPGDDDRLGCRKTALQIPPRLPSRPALQNTAAGYGHGQLPQRTWCRALM